MITKSELIEYLKHTPENTNYNILYSSLYNGSNKEAVDEFIEVLSRGNLSLAALQPYLAKLYEDDKTISPEPLPPFSSGGGSVPKPLTYDYMPDGYPKKSVLFNVEWDGNTEGLTSLYNFYKVSDLVVDPSVFASGATLTYADGSTDFMSIDDASSKNSITIEPGKVIFGEGQVMIFTETPAPPYEAFEIGVYFESDEIYDVRKVTGGEVITPMAEEFLPNIPADKLPAGGGGSADAVLYTAQTLTDAQKKQARENIDAASEFVVNGTINGEYGEYDVSTATLDKTFAQIKEALSAGKVPTMRITGGTVGIDENSVPIYLHYASALMETVELKYITFVGMLTNDTVAELVVYADGNTRFTTTELITLSNYDGMPVMPQQTMDSDPTEAMQIATKKYVDDHAGGGTDMGITGATVGQVAKITAVDASGTPTAWEPADMPSGGGAITYDIAATAERSVQNNTLQDFKCSVSSKQLRKAIDTGKTPRLVIKIRTTTMYMPMTNYFLVGAEYAYVNFGCVDEYGLENVVCDGESEVDAGKPIWLASSSFVTPTY